MTAPIAFLTLDHISKSYNGRPVLEDISFSVERGSFTSIFGPNASGKTTLLNIISGLDRQDSGQLTRDPGTHPFRISYVFQNYTESLLPWETVEQNIALPLKLAGTPRIRRRKEVAELVEKYHIDLDLRKYPYQLSGGQQQLVAILRGLIVGPDLLLLDEPFSAIDFQKKLYLHAILLEIWQKTRTTILFISHDLDEAIYLADKVLLLGGFPSRILMIQSNDLPRPRTPDIMGTAHFALQKGRLLDCFLENSTLNSI